MRVISGIYKGKLLEGFLIDGTRPTMDRVKESLFGIIQTYIEGSICLDLFAGSGSLGIEALSNGCKKCIFVDKNKEILKILENNLNEVKVDHKIIKKDYKEALNNLDIKFDIIFLDPPYNDNLISPAIELILNNNLLNDDGIIVCEYEKENIVCSLNLFKEKKYGQKNIKIFKKDK